MVKRTSPRIATVILGEAPLSLRVRWHEGGESIVDVSALIDTFSVYTPLQKDPALFEQVEVGAHGGGLAWADSIYMAATLVWRLAQEQSGKTLTAEGFRAWRERRAYTLDAAAKALGLSRRMVAYYEHGEKPIPRTVTLATRALEMDAALTT